jgi:hypothetical protein
MGASAPRTVFENLTCAGVSCWLGCVTTSLNTVGNVFAESKLSLRWRCA